MSESRDGYVRFWLSPSCEFIPVDYHEKFAKEKFPQCKKMSNSECYHFMMNQKFVRIVIEGNKVWFEYCRGNFVLPPSKNQMKALKDFAISNDKTLYDGTLGKNISLNEDKKK
jgi:hypothetical protein